MTESDTSKLHELADLVHAIARQLPAPANLEPGPCTPVEISVMRFVAKHPGASARDAASATRLPSSNFSRVLRGLIIKGLLERRRNKLDARGVSLYPTELAEANARRMEEAWSGALAGASLDLATIDRVTGALGRIEAHLASGPQLTSVRGVPAPRHAPEPG